jgi:hypothetical protein
MNRQPVQQQISAAEMRFAASRERTRMAVNTLRVTFQSKFARPSTLACAAGAGVLIGKFLLGPKKRPAKTRNELAASGIAAALLSRFGWKFLTGAALKMWLSRKQPSRARQLRITPPHASSRTLGDTLH